MCVKIETRDARAFNVLLSDTGIEITTESQCRMKRNLLTHQNADGITSP